MNIEEMHSWFDVLQDKGDSPYFTVDEKTQFLNRAMTKYVNAVLNNSFLISGGQPENKAIPYNTMESVQSGEDAIRPLITDLRSSNKHVYDRFPTQYTPSVNRYGQFSINQLNYYVRGRMKSQDDAYSTASTWEKTKVLHILSVAWADNPHVQLRYVRASDVGKYRNNSFKRPVKEDPMYFAITGGSGMTYEIQPRWNPDGTEFKNFYLGNGSGLSGGYYNNIAYPTDNTDDWPDNLSNLPPDGAHTSTSNPLWHMRLLVSVVRTPLPLRYDPINSNNNVSCELPDWTHDDIMAIALDDAGVASRDQALMTLNQASKANLTPPQ